MRVKSVTVVVLVYLICFFISACGGGGGGDNTAGDTPVNVVDEKVQDAQALEAASLSKGGSAHFKSVDVNTDGAFLIVPPGSVEQDATLVIAVEDEFPAGAPWGQNPTGSLFELGPTGLTFDSDNRALLTLPLSPGGIDNNIYIGRWNEITDTWENLGGTIQGDFISTELVHLSLYGVFSQGRSLVRIVNDVIPEEDPGDSGISIQHISGPLPPSDWPEAKPFPAHRIFVDDEITLKTGESQVLSLPAGQYHFAVSYPSPFQVTNSLRFVIPELASGADDGIVDQVITIDGDGAYSTDDKTDLSLFDFPGSWTVPDSNLPPVLECGANVVAGVPVFNNDAGANGLPSRRVGIGPIVIPELGLNSVELVGTATDPEGSLINHYWTWSQHSTLPARVLSASAEEVSRFFRPNPKREGRYDVFLTSYDDFGLFDECHWEITVRGNERPTIEVIADDYIVDFGRLGSERINGDSALDRLPLGASTDGMSWCNYIDTNSDGTLDTTLLKTVPILPASESPDHVFRPTQYPKGMSCLYALVGDVDGDALEAGFRFPHNGDLYDAMTGAKITTAQQLADYNALLSATMAAFPVPEILDSFAPLAAFALPIIWEAPDNMVSTLPGSGGAPGLATHDCRHLHMDPIFVVDAGPCVDIPGTYPAGGITAIVATVTDGLSREQIDDFGVGYGEDKIVRLDGSDGGGGSGGGGGGSDPNKPPLCSDDSVTTSMGQSVTVPIWVGDPDFGDEVSYTITDGPANGALDGDSYTPNGSYFGIDSFTYVASDGKASSETCTIEITIKEVRRYHVFKLAGTGYNKRFGGFATRVTGFHYFSVWDFPSQIDGIVGTGFDNTSACNNGAWAGPVLEPSIWENRAVTFVGIFDTFEEMDTYRCEVPTWYLGNMICNQWDTDSDPKYWSNINSICGS